MLQVRNYLSGPAGIEPFSGVMSVHSFSCFVPCFPFWNLARMTAMWFTVYTHGFPLSSRNPTNEQQQYHVASLPPAGATQKCRFPPPAFKFLLSPLPFHSWGVRHLEFILYSSCAPLCCCFCWAATMQACNDEGEIIGSGATRGQQNHFIHAAGPVFPKPLWRPNIRPLSPT